MKRKKSEENFLKVIKLIHAKANITFQVEITYLHRKLKKIRKALAIISISKFWKKKRLNFKSFKEKILRVKRRIFAFKNRESYQKQLVTKIEDNNKSVDIKSNDEEIDKLLDETAKKAVLEKKIIQAKIEKTKADLKLSYAVPGLKLTEFLPYLQPRTDNSIDEETDDRIEPTEAYLQKLNSKINHLVYRNTQISIPHKLDHKRYYDPKTTPSSYQITLGSYSQVPGPLKLPAKVKDANFLKNTISYSSRLNPVMFEIKLLSKVSNPKYNYLKKDTISYSQKRRKMNEIYDRTPEWKWSMRSVDEYMPSIHNVSYTPSPLPAKPKKSRISPSYHRKKINSLSFDQKLNNWSSSLLSALPSTMEASTEYLNN